MARVCVLQQFDDCKKVTHSYQKADPFFKEEDSREIFVPYLWQK